MNSALRNTAPRPEEELPVIRFRGENFEPMASGALFWRAEETLLVADLHLEKMSSFARKGQFLPPYDTGLTLRRLQADLAATRARRLIALGDSFHRDEGVHSLQPADQARLAAMMAQTEFLWLAGNHDPRPHLLGGRCDNRHAERDLHFVHEPAHGLIGQIAGHLHPAARIAINGRSARRACFVHDERLMILPAYGASTGNLNILSAAFTGLFDWSRLQVTMLGRDRVYPVNPRRLMAG